MIARSHSTHVNCYRHVFVFLLTHAIASPTNHKLPSRVARRQAEQAGRVVTLVLNLYGSRARTSTICIVIYCTTEKKHENL